MSRFWPLRESAQADYEILRAQVLEGTTLSDLCAARFARFGLAGLITRPTTAPVLMATLVGAHRPPWSPHVDPRQEALADGYEMLINSLSARRFDFREAQS
ncbi:MAG: hypothetical protein ACREOM_06850 [Candidatus Dormibacteraceae bacterium]